MNRATLTASDLGTPPELAWLPVDALDVDPAYQRSLDTKQSRALIAKIAETFDWLKFGALIAVPNPKAEGSGAPRWLLLDGQHRAEGAKQRGVPHVPAVVHRQIDVAEQASVFVAANRDRLPMSAQALYHARVLAGDADAVTIARICAEAKIEVVRSNLAASRFPAGRTAAVPAMLRILRLYGDDIARRAILAVAECFGQQDAALRSPFFQAAGQFLYQGGGDEGLRLALEKLGWRNLEAAGYGLGGSSAIAEMVAKMRNAIGVKAQAEPSESKPSAEPKSAPIAQPSRPAPAPSAPAPRMVPRHSLDADQAAIDKFIAERGVKVVMAPERVAELLRDAGHRVTLLERDAIKFGNGYVRQRQPVIDGAERSMAEMYAAANALRTKAGLPELSLPVDAAA